MTGVVEGGWEYVYACYLTSWVFVIGYGASLWIRSREER